MISLLRQMKLSKIVCHRIDRTFGWRLVISRLDFKMKTKRKYLLNKNKNQIVHTASFYLIWPLSVLNEFQVMP